MREKIRKDMITRCPAAARASARADNAGASVGLDNVIRGRGRDVTPGGRPRYKNAGTNGHTAGRKFRSNPAARSGIAEKCRPLRLGAGPRAAHRCQLPPSPAGAVAADSAVLVGGVAAARDRCLDSARWPAGAANAAPLPDTTHCNSVLADTAAKTAVHSP